MAQNDLVRLAAEQAAAQYDIDHSTCGNGLFTGARFGRRLCRFAGIKRKLLPPDLVRVILAGRSDVTAVSTGRDGLYKLR